MDGADVTGFQPSSMTPTAIGMALLGVLAIIGGSLGQFVAWIGAVVNTARLDDKTWFVVLLVLGLLSFGFIAMLVYVLAGPDGTAPAPAPPTNPRPEPQHEPIARLSHRHLSTEITVMSTRVAINGFGRVGRLSLRALIERTPDIEIVAVNDLVPVALERDPVQARLDVRGLPGRRRPHRGRPRRRRPDDPGPPGAGSGRTCRGATSASTSSSSRPASSPRPTRPRAHLDAGAKKVIISAPAKGEDITIVLGVNDEHVRPGTGTTIISNASCTTNCLAPAVKVVNDLVGIELGLMNTIHSYTNDQRILDVAHKDPRRARAAGQNIIPTTTGRRQGAGARDPGAQGQGRRLQPPRPDAHGERRRLHRAGAPPDERRGAQRRLPTRPRPARWRGILGVSDEPLVSTDFRGDARSSIIDAASTMVLGGTFIKVIAWYDNEWGYSCRIADLVALVAARLPVYA